MRLPSGDQRGLIGQIGEFARSSALQWDVVQTLWRLFVGIEVGNSTTAKATVLPSGESCGSAIR